jgi:hypothetical protein
MFFVWSFDLKADYGFRDGRFFLGLSERGFKGSLDRAFLQDPIPASGWTGWLMALSRPLVRVFKKLVMVA